MPAEAPPARCPTCRKVVPPPAPHRPFCSDRCRLLDLGKWCDGDYAVPAPEREEEE